MDLSIYIHLSFLDCRFEAAEMAGKLLLFRVGGEVNLLLFIVTLIGGFYIYQK